MIARGTRLIGALTIGVAVLAAGSVAAGTFYFGWADEFIGYETSCSTTDQYGNGGCISTSAWEGPSSDFPHYPLTWETVGNQGANATGRANAREKVMFRFDERAPYSCATATVTLSRYRSTTLPTYGQPCSAIVGTYVGAAAQTIDSCGVALGDYVVNNRMLPVLDFSAETAPAGTTIAYRTTYVLNASNSMGGGSSTQEGCYKINWVQ